jgi:hypothetical protein
MKKVSALSSFWLMLLFAGALVMPLIVTLAWYFLNYGKAP